MEQEKIGKFILELRKEKNMTQSELAKKIGVTDRAISKWENGRGLPDLSLMRPLCEELGITINELLSGERISKKNYQEKLEENILNTLNYTDKKIEKNKKRFKILFLTIVLLIIILTTLFLIDVARMNQNKPVFFSTWGFKYMPALDLKDEKIKKAIENYFILKKETETKQENIKSFVSMKIYSIKEKDDFTYLVYVWILEESYYLENDVLKQDSGSSIPYKVMVKLIDDNYMIWDIEFPSDGNYSYDMKKLFPRRVRKAMANFYFDGSSEILKLDIEKQLKLYFHK